MPISRRQFVKTVAAAGIAGEWASNLAGSPATEPAASQPVTPPPPPDPTAAVRGVDLRWLDGQPPALIPGGVTWGALGPAAVPANSAFSLTADNTPHPVQSWPLAFWPDGSLKWTAHATPADALPGQLRLAPAPAAVRTRATSPLTVHETDQLVDINTGAIRCRIPKTGQHFIESITRNDQPIVARARLVCLCQDAPTLTQSGSLTEHAYTSDIEKVTVEQTGPVRAVVRIEGRHLSTASASAARRWLPFSLRLYFYAGSDAVRLMHTFVFDGDPDHDFIRGLAVRFDVPLRDLLHDRHVRFAGQGAGLWAEPVRNLTGLRRDPGPAVTEAQLAGKPCPPIDQIPPRVADHLDLIPAWDAYSLFQSSADAFTIRKRTAGGSATTQPAQADPPYCWITAAHGSRASGLAYVGGPTGGCAFGLRDFWQRHPTELTIESATSPTAVASLWLYSPRGPAMDFRPYHGDMGMTDTAAQLAALDVTYEDYEPGYSSAVGIARTSEITLWALPATPSRDTLVNLAEAVRNPPVLCCPPAHYRACQVFGDNWSLPDHSTPERDKIERQLDWYLDYYRTQVEQRRWYGFWDYGDVMHTYDPARHCWRYDVGGFAWDNSELSPDLWLWYAFLRTGDAATFRFAEAMTRHTGEVDVYHLGRFAMLGSRHNVLHWGDSSKQLRVSTPAYRRFYYFLTADERTGDLLRELAHAEQTFATNDPQRKVRRDGYKPEPHALSVTFGFDFGALAAAWLTEWERTNDPQVRQKLLNAMTSIASMPHGFFTGYGAFDPDTGTFTNILGDGVDISHLNAVFGLAEISAELILLLDVPPFEKAWLDYCTYYSANPAARAAALGFTARSDTLVVAHSRLTAYAAFKKQDSDLAARAWQEFATDDPRTGRYTFATRHVTGPDVITPVDEAPLVSTNDAAQWALAAIQNLRYLP